MTAAVVAALDDTRPAEGPPTLALGRWLDACWGLLDAYPVLLQRAVLESDPEHDDERHAPIASTLMPLLARGQRTGEFDRDHSPAWLLAAILALGHAAGHQAATGRMTVRAAGRAFRDGVLRVVAGP